MFTLKKWIISLQKRASRNKPSQKKWEDVDQSSADDEQKKRGQRKPPAGPEYFIPFPKG